MKSTSWLGNVIRTFFFLTRPHIYLHIKIITVFRENLIGLGGLYEFT